MRLSKKARALLATVDQNGDPFGVVAAGMSEKRAVAELVAAGLVTADVKVDSHYGYLARLKKVG